jgi:hypothetical protein
MKHLPQTENPLVLRTDFSNQAAWETIRIAAQKPVGMFGFRANLQFLDEAEYAGLSKDQVLQLIPDDYNHSFIVIADRIAMRHSEHPVLIVDLFERSGREFRAIPSTVQSIENNLSLANMDFEEFAEAVDDDRIFRGFSRGA